MNKKVFEKFMSHERVFGCTLLALLASTMTLAIFLNKLNSSYDSYIQSSQKLILKLNAENRHEKGEITNLVSQISKLEARQDSQLDEMLIELAKQNCFHEKISRLYMLDYLEFAYADQPALIQQLSEIQSIMRNEKFYSPKWNETVERLDKAYFNSLKTSSFAESLIEMQDAVVSNSTDPNTMTTTIKDIQNSEGIEGVVKFLTSSVKTPKQTPYVKDAKIVAVLPYSHQIILDDGSLYEASEFQDHSVMRWNPSKSVNVHDWLPANSKGFNAILFSSESKEDHVIVKKIGFVNLN